MSEFKFKPRINFVDFQPYQNKTLFMLCGPSYTGKSSWIQQVADRSVPSVVVSTDEYIDRLAKSKGLSYLEVWGKDSYHEAYEHLRAMVFHAIKLEINIYWDQTNLTWESRKHKLGLFPEDWKKIAIYLRDPFRESSFKRREKRHYKVIPEDVLREQYKKWEKPTEDEGFDAIWVIENEGW